MVRIPGGPLWHRVRVPSWRSESQGFLPSEIRARDLRPPSLLPGLGLDELK